ncbi:MAG: autotransporter outer membrane beta-barrel domain-containing protein, partial [Acidobacteriaceae bacterium]|nr:autotransporter outer membrane beta-barrel domain-containing protein [Acidobacteriaceae bacterium]
GASAPLAGGDGLANFRIDGTLTNAALVNISVPGRVGNTLTVGSYVGLAGVMTITTVLGDDASPTDRLIINGGSASGTTVVQFTTSGAGGLTKGDGILIVDARNGATTTPDSFKASGPLSTPLYDYTFSRGGLTTPSDNWYLRSTYREELSDDAAVTPLTQLYSLALVGTLHERVGDEMRLQGRTDLKDQVWGNGAWGRILGLRGAWDGGGLQANGPAFDYHLYAVQGGIDLYRREHDNGSRDHVGVLGSAGQVSSTVTSDAGNPAGGVTLDIKTFGATWTHFGESGWYVDGLAQYGWINATLTSPRMRTVTKGTNLTASLEGGYPLALNGRTLFEPQAQLVYQRASFNPITDALSTITLDNATEWTGRLGARLSRTFGAQSASAPQPRATAWGRASLWKDFAGASALNIDATSIRATLGNSWLDLGGGGDVRLSGLFTLYGTISYQTAVSGSRHAITGSGGLRLNW